MKAKGYILFHLNLAFSSIEEDSWADVIKTCYHPLLDLIEKTGIPIGIELTGWTLKQIERIDVAWIERFKVLLNLGKCELIGSGYCQIIGPLAPYRVNEWNQKLGIDSYKKILDRRPEIILVNEMAFSSSLVDLYSQFEYKGFIMDRDNITLALRSSNSTYNQIPTHAKGVDGSVMPVLWSDSILFQKVQHFAHGDISINDYLDYLKKRINHGELVIPIYTNDAEVFDYRPGRFSEERPMHPEGEWIRIEKLLRAIIENTDIEFVSPAQALKISTEGRGEFSSKLVTAAYPIPVKKQAKYNLARWAVSGRDDLWLNTMCHRIEKHLSRFENDNHNDWRNLCELWASDLRTHITEKRWDVAKNQLNEVLNKFSISDSFDASNQIDAEYSTLESAIGEYGGAKISIDKDSIVLRISTKYMELELNLRKGLAIKSLAFSSHGMEPCVGTLPHGFFSCISLGADYYSGGVVVECPLKKIRVSDLVPVTPRFLLNDTGCIEVHTEIKTQFGTIIKVINISVDSEKVSLNYMFPEWDAFIGSVKLGTITLLNQFSHENTQLSCSNGGNIDETFDFSGEFNHAAPASTLVSSSRGLGATTGKLKIENNNKNIFLQWNPSDCAVMPMLYNQSFDRRTLSRVFFSMKEEDDTSKIDCKFGAFVLKITTSL